MRTRLFVAVAVWIAGAAGGPLALEAKAAWGTNNQHKLVPAYFYPDWWNAGNAWYRMCDSMETAEGPSTAMMNPSSGPGSAANPDYQRVIDYCHGRGQRVIGYVHTSYGSRSATDVKADIDAMYAFYPAIDGIYLDEMSNSSSTRSYYRDLYVYVKGKAGVRDVVGGPGIAASSDWQLSTPVVDELVVFEGTAATYQRWSPPAWVKQRVASQFSQLVYAASNESTMRQVCRRSKSLNAGYIYVTGDVLPNPWDTLPLGSYWTNEIAAC
jgi:Spherulation-specific family 4